MHLRHVPVDHVRAERPGALGARDAEVFAGGKHPQGVDHLRGPPEIAGREIAQIAASQPPLPQAVVEGVRRQRTRGHPLSVDGVEAAQRVAEHNESVGRRL
jgi:hypothetical protein